MEEDQAALQHKKINTLFTGIVAWFIMTLLMGIFEFDITARFFIFTILVKLLISSIGIIFLFLSASWMLQRTSTRLFIASLVIIIVGCVHSFALPWFELSEQIKLSAMMPKYKAIIEKLSTPREHAEPYTNGVSEIDGVRLIRDQNQRIAFMWFSGVTDNWTAIVYDPTALVERANEFQADWSNWNDPDLENVKNVFGGDLVRTIKIDTNWYKCVFT